MDLLVRGGTVVTVDPDDRILRADIAVASGRIVAIGADLDVAATRVLDAAGAVVIPGLCNAHMHETLERGVFEDLPFVEWLEDYALPKDRAYEPRHIRAAALLNQAEMIAGGTTSFIDIFRHPVEAATVAERSGLRATFSPQVIDDPVGVGETLADNEAFVAEWCSRPGGRIRAWFGPHSLYSCRPATFERMRERADALGRQVCRGEDGVHAFGLAGLFDVDACDARVRQGAADDKGVQRALRGEVVDVLPAPGEQRRVLAAGQRLSDQAHDALPIAVSKILCHGGPWRANRCAVGVAAAIQTAHPREMAEGLGAIMPRPHGLLPLPGRAGSGPRLGGRGTGRWRAGRRVG